MVAGRQNLGKRAYRRRRFPPLKVRSHGAWFWPFISQRDERQSPDVPRADLSANYDPA